jgi:hypothetical protein
MMTLFHFPARQIFAAGLQKAVEHTLLLYLRRAVDTARLWFGSDRVIL